jgi:hypothetical protein
MSDAGDDAPAAGAASVGIIVADPPLAAGDINFAALFPGVENHGIWYVLHMCGLRDPPSQTRLIEFQGIKNVQDLANYTDAEIDTMAAPFQAYPSRYQGPDGTR